MGGQRLLGPLLIIRLFQVGFRFIRSILLHDPTGSPLQITCEDPLARGIRDSFDNFNLSDDLRAVTSTQPSLSSMATSQALCPSASVLQPEGFFQKY